MAMEKPRCKGARTTKSLGVKGLGVKGYGLDIVIGNTGSEKGLGKEFWNKRGSNKELGNTKKAKRYFWSILLAG